MNLTTPIADFKYEERNNILIIYDLDTGPSVTNTIRAVLHKIQSDVPDLKSKKIIYSDSEKTFDGILLSKEGSFLNFYSIGVKNREEAIAIVQKKFN